MPAEVIVQQGNEIAIGQRAAESGEVEDGKSFRLSALARSKSEYAGIATAMGVRGGYSPVICFPDGFGQYARAEQLESCEFTSDGRPFIPVCSRSLPFPR
jgi:hypothetical protein